MHPPERSLGGSEFERSARISGRAVRAVSHARPPPSRTPERRRSTSPKLRFGRGCCRNSTKRRVEKTHSLCVREAIRNMTIALASISHRDTPS
ncbi:hypothetical protein CEE69_08985 [Rhodopirellula bahusiensis]|uniref:Uncharacterized protein n=1 Tax=Rhodopirellula bahusiensis TaxID=2014065 RepID=A0A2G1W9N5_9BACT|nr:hypothetical protein CEE69_08985 [Rhodopirellula bahusiensis]